MFAPTAAPLVVAGYCGGIGRTGDGAHVSLQRSAAPSRWDHAATADPRHAPGSSLCGESRLL